MRDFEDNSGVPVEEGEEYNVKIESVGDKGDGVAKVDGFVLFIPDTKVGDRVKVKVTKVLSKMGFAEKIGEADASAEKEKEKKEKDEDEEIDLQPELASESFGEE